MSQNNPSNRKFLSTQGIFKPSSNKCWAVAIILVVTLVGTYSLLFSHAATLTGDINGDGVINIQDLSLLLSSYGQSRSTCATNTSYTCDLNGDGVINVFDLSIILTNYGHTVTPPPPPPPPPPSPPPAWWKPTSSSSISWNWVIGNTPSTPYANVSVYDIDGFDNSASTISTMHSEGKKVICYIDVGTYEPGRPDLSLIPTADIGSGVQGWPGEKWLNIADVSGLTPLVQSRMNMCKSKGFDAIEPDNIDGYTNSTGFSLTASNQLTYNQFLATTAHNLGLSIGLKNDVDQTSQLQPYFDWALDEECNKYTECNTLAPFTSANKAVFNAEYTSDGETTAKFCSADAAAHINGVLYDLNLDGVTFQPCTQTW
jgi:hypothetical protein